jgi:hypothetical protein
MFTIRESGIFAQTFTTLYLFGSGGIPVTGLVEGASGNINGTTYGYAGKQDGMIYEITPSGTLTTLYNFGPFPGGT